MNDLFKKTKTHHWSICKVELKVFELLNHRCIILLSQVVTIYL